MNLCYSVLWVDDVKTWVTAKNRMFRAYLAEKSLELSDDYCDTIKEAEDKIKISHNYDLILIDYKFGIKREGDKLIQLIRDMKIFSTIIFYSQDGEEILRNKLANRKLEGVFCLDRRTGFESSKFKDIISNTIRRTEDPNFIRGLVMAETSDLDMSMLDVKKAIFSSKKLTKEKHAAVEKKAKEYIIVQSNQNKQQAEDLQVSELILKPFFDSNKKHRLLKHLLEKSESESLKNYASEIIDERNIFAHAREEISSAGQKVLISHIDPTPRIIDENLCKAVRSNIKKYKVIFQGLKDKYCLK
ncbi:MAG: hypothetical protein WC721_20080 [Victivallaceae bacterium]|jgi:CheY-like chemotaxis protein